MPETVTVRYRWTWPEVREAFRWHRRQTWRGRYGRWILLLLVAASVGYAVYVHLYVRSPDVGTYGTSVTAVDDPPVPAAATPSADSTASDADASTPDTGAATDSDGTVAEAPDTDSEDAATEMETARVARPRDWSLWIAYGVPIYVGLLLGLRFTIQRRIVRRAYAGSAARDLEVQWDISESLVRMQYPHGKSEFTWQAFVKAVQTPRGLLLYLHPGSYQWLPKTGFASGEDFEQVVRWLYANIPNYRHVK